MKTKVTLKPVARLRSLFQLAAKYKTMKDQNEPTPVARRVGIIERLKNTNSPGEVAAVVGEFKTFLSASEKTKRRFFRVLDTKVYAV